MRSKPHTTDRPFYVGKKSITYLEGPSYLEVTKAFDSGEPVSISPLNGDIIRIRVTGIFLLKGREYCFEGMFIHPNKEVADLRHRVECHTSLDSENDRYSGTYFPHPTLPAYD